MAARKPLKAKRLPTKARIEGYQNRPWFWAVIVLIIGIFILLDYLFR